MKTSEDFIYRSEDAYEEAAAEFLCDSLYSTLASGENSAETVRTEKEALKAFTKLYGDTTFLTPQKILLMSQDIRKQISNPSVPWILASVNMRYSFTFKEDTIIKGDDSKLKEIRAIPQNKDFLRPNWLRNFQMSTDSSGSLFLIRNKVTGVIFTLPPEQLKEVYADDDNSGYITHIKRDPTASYWNKIHSRRGVTSNGSKDYIIPKHDNTLTETQFRKLTGEKDVYYNDNYEFFDYHAIKPLDQPLAAPPLLLSTLYTTAAARLLSDTSRYKHSASLLAVKVSAQTKAAANKGVEELAAVSKAGGIGGYTNDYQVSGMGTNGLNISNTGAIEFLAPAAASLNIPVTQYSMTVMGQGGTAGSLVTLDRPTRSFYEAEGASRIDFFKEILGNDIEITFTESSSDSVAKNIASSMSLYTGHVIHQDEMRGFGAEQLNIELLHEEPPEIPEIPDMGTTIAPKNATRDSGHDNEPNLDGTED